MNDPKWLKFEQEFGICLKSGGVMNDFKNSMGLNKEHSNSEPIRNLSVSMFGLWMVQY